MLLRKIILSRRKLRCRHLRVYQYPLRVGKEMCTVRSGVQMDTTDEVLNFHLIRNRTPSQERSH